MTADRLPDELRALGRTIATPPVDHEAVAAEVLRRLAGSPAPVTPKRWRRAVSWVATTVRQRRRRAVLAVVSGLLLALVLTPPVRATVADWFGFAGVLVRFGPSLPSASVSVPPAVAAPSGPAPSTAGPSATVPSATGTLDEAARRVGFSPVVPRMLGAPDGVEVSADRRLLSLSWRENAGTLRLDEFEGRLAPLFFKTVGGRGAEYVYVGEQSALWFPTPHEVVLIDKDGGERRESARPAGPTLVWESGGVTLRLEGVPDRKRAVEIAESVPEPGTNGGTR
ncbi:hypothetical protein [Actinopolymorpha alba]|uniref:hypothetical protein n=1 Tax=Actinopolymorpha alba TaxID=533267 RepID=UPI00037DEEC8|nr:hypothetical protein [Actinopolymorpha alba]